MAHAVSGSKWGHEGAAHPNNGIAAFRYFGALHLATPYSRDSTDVFGAMLLSLQHKF